MSVKKEKSGISPALLKFYDELISSFRSMKRKGAIMPYTSVNGHMFSFLSSDGKMALRLPETEREAFIKKFHSQLFSAHGSVLKEYVTIPEKLLKNVKAMNEYFTVSYEYVSSLKPKTTSKKKK